MAFGRVRVPIVGFGRRPILATSGFVLFRNECFADPIMVDWESGSGIGFAFLLGKHFLFRQSVY